MQLPYANLRMEHWNPGASAPLTLPIHVICNTSDERIYTQIYQNSRNGCKWVAAQEPHAGVAILCGSGPSLGDHLPEIFNKQRLGGKVFALNGAAKFLNEHGIFPDYQVILDARAETAQLIGPAKEHLFASQVAPELFEQVPIAKLWQLQVEGIDHILPEYDDDYCLIGGAASVGNTATCLVYAMGYRTLEIYGYDSSHREGKGHAFHQKMNDGDPCAIVKFKGKEYTTSLTMKLQAEKFQSTAQELIDLGCTLNVHGDGLLPDIFNARDSSEHMERAKYEAMWNIPTYRDYAPGENLVLRAISEMNMRPGQSVIDFGCGTGRSLRVFQENHLEVTGFDIASNCLDAGITAPLRIGCLWELPEDMKADYGYCTDVMEHIPPAKIDSVIQGIMRCVSRAFFQISLKDDEMGSLIGEKLHLSIHSYQWWLQKFKKLGFIVVASDDLSDVATFQISQKS